MVRDVGSLHGAPGHANIVVIARSTPQRVQRVLKRVDESRLIALRERRQRITRRRRV